MFTISVETFFWASHRLRLPDGSAEPMHSHNWRVTVDVGADKLDEMGVVMDFVELKSMVEEITGELSNSCLNDLDALEGNFSAENVARYIYERIEPKLAAGVCLESVAVEEQAGCRARFRK